MKARIQKSRLIWISRVCIILAGVAIVVGGIITRRQWNENRTIHMPAAQSEENNTDGSDAPATVKPAPSEFEQYQVPASNPRYLSIPSLSIKAMVKPVGVTAKNQLQSPANVFDVGWYTKSTKPGDSGVTVMDGHVSSWETRGIFYNLKDLKKGDLITVQRGDGQILTYKMIKQQVYDADKVDMAAALSPVSHKPGLNLITCGGKVIKGTNNFDKRIVVFAEQL